jgi:muramidase (phage lysozyme)
MYSQAKPASDDGIMKAPQGDQIDAGSWWAWLSGATRQKAQENIARVQEELSKMNVDFSGTSPQYQQELLDGILQARQYRKDWGITESLSDKPKLLEQQGDFPIPEQSEVTTEELPPMDEEASLESRLSNIRYVRSDNDETIDVSPAAEAADQQGIMTKPKATPVATTTTDYTPPDDATQRLLERIAIGEGAKPELLQLQDKHGIGTTQYDMVYGFGDYVVPSKPVSEMTMKELFDYQKKLISATKGKVPGTKYGTSAVGKYQFVKTSLFGKGGTADKPGKNSWADKLNLKADTVFTPEIQEKLGMLVLQEAGYNSYIKGKKSEDSFLNGIANKWASVEGSTANQHIATKKKDLRPILKNIKSLVVKRDDTNRDYSPRPMLRPTE